MNTNYNKYFYIASLDLKRNSGSVYLSRFLYRYVGFVYTLIPLKELLFRPVTLFKAYYDILVF